MDFEITLTPRQLIREAIKAAKQVAKDAELSEKATFRAKLFVVDSMFRMIANVVQSKEKSDDDIEELLERMMEALVEGEA